MSKTRYRWWGYIKNVIRAYPELKKEYDALHQQSVTANLSGMPGSGSVSRGTENIATRELPRTKQKEYDAVRKAIETTQRTPMAKDVLTIIDLCYWKKKYKKLEDAAWEANVSYMTARRYHWRFLMEVAKNCGLLDEEVCDG